MPNYVSAVADIELGGGDLKINKIDSSYSDSDLSKFVSLGGTVKEVGGVLRLDPAKVKEVFRENDADEPAIAWTQGRDVFFDTTLLECSLENFVLAIGEDLNTIIDNVGANPKYKYFRGPSLSSPRLYPFLYEVPQEANPGLKDILIMPACEILGAVEIGFKDEKPRSLKLSLKLHKVRPIESSFPETVVNGSFESLGSGSSNPFSVWSATQTGSSVITAFTGSKDQAVDSDGRRIDPVHTGLRSCKIVIDGSDHEGSVSQTIVTETGKNYILSLWHCRPRLTPSSCTPRSAVQGV